MVSIVFTAYQKSNRPRVQGEFAGRQVPGGEATVPAPARKVGPHQAAGAGMGHDSNLPLLTPLIIVGPASLSWRFSQSRPLPLIMIPIENYLSIYILSLFFSHTHPFFEKELFTFFFLLHNLSQRPWLNRLSVKKKLFIFKK